MCFGSKVKTPKPAPPSAAQPVVAEDPKGVEFGGEESTSKDENSNDKITKVEREGDSSDTPSALSTASSPTRKKSTMSSSAVRKSLKRA